MPHIINGESLIETATRQLQAEKPRDWRARYHGSDASGATRSAARLAHHTGQDAYVVAGNRYGAFCWHVSQKRADATCLVTNYGKRAFRVTPTAEVYSIEFAS